MTAALQVLVDRDYPGERASSPAPAELPPPRRLRRPKPPEAPMLCAEDDDARAREAPGPEARADGAPTCHEEGRRHG